MTSGRSGRLRFAGVVPAAGASARMGRTKALLPIEGETFLTRVVRALRDGGCAPVYVVTAGEAALADVARATGAEILENPEPGEGPITSLRLALRALAEEIDGVAYLPVDHPLVSPSVVATLLGEAEGSDAALTLPIVGAKRGHPALFRRSLFEALLDPELEGGARTVVHANLVNARLVPMDDPGPVIDIDTPEAYERVAGCAPERGAPGARDGETDRESGRAGRRRGPQR